MFSFVATNAMLLFEIWTNEHEEFEFMSSFSMNEDKLCAIIIDLTALPSYCNTRYSNWKKENELSKEKYVRVNQL